MKKFGKKQMTAYGLGAVGKDMVYALSANFVMYYYQDILGLSASFVGLILMIARVFDALNDPFMGIIVAKTDTKWGKFRPFLFSGTILNAFVLFALFNAPDLGKTGLMVFFSVIYILWGMTYTMMDIPYWSMIPAVTTAPKDREKMSVVGRTCAGVGNAIITVSTILLVSKLGAGVERVGFRYFALIVAILFVVFEVYLCAVLNEQKATKKMETTTVKEMFKALFANDQALITVVTIVLVNFALYLTFNLVIYFFKYDIGPSVIASGGDWQGNYTLFTTVGGGGQILGMMLVYPLLRKKFSNTQIFKLSLMTACLGYALILIICLANLASNMALLCICGMLVFAANGILTVLTTVFLSDSVDYGELKTGKRQESVIFSMQTFVVKLASGLAVFLTGVGLDLINLQGNSSTDGMIATQTPSTILGLRLLMTILPMIGLVAAFVLFAKKFVLTDEKCNAIAEELKVKHNGN